MVLNNFDNILSNNMRCIDKLCLIDYYDRKKISQVNKDVYLSNLIPWDPMDTKFEGYEVCPVIYQIMLHSKGKPRTMNLLIKDTQDKKIYHIDTFYINSTGDTVINTTGILSNGLSSYDLYINSTVPLTDVYGNISFMAFKID